MDQGITWIKQRRHGGVALVSLLILFFSDNIAWFVNFSRSASHTGNVHYVSKGEYEVFQWMNRHVGAETLVISTNTNISYMVPAYTSGHSWYSHYFTTPYKDRKIASMESFIQSGITDSSWQDKDLLYIAEKSSAAELTRLEAIRPIAEKTLDFRDFRLVKFRLPMKKK
ncbi:MAG: hypothetical protein DI538_26925 [Azospira oryzae]|nr:MAG: hypothetical protein DI538_26925 [Azospira oryzae]